jgi:hypothetical protein
MTIHSKQASYPAAGKTSWKPDEKADYRGGAGVPGEGWWHPKSVLALDFLNDAYASQGAASSLAALLSTTRSSTDYGFDAGGNLVQFSANTARRADGIGLFAGGQFTNKIRNPRGEGATVGVVGAGGALPTNWAVGVGAGLSTEVKGVGTESGLPYVELRISGTASSTTDYTLLFDNSTNAAGAAGDAWGVDMRVRAVAGTQVPIRVAGVDYAGGTAQNVASSAPATPTGSIARLQKTFVSAYATTTNVRAMMRVAVSSGVAYDFTLRIHAPKLCKIGVAYGPELVVNPGNPFSATTGWTPGNNVSVAVASGALRVQKAAPSGGATATTSFNAADGYIKFESAGATPGGGSPGSRIDIGVTGALSSVLNSFTVQTAATRWIPVQAAALILQMSAGGTTAGNYVDYAGVSVKQAIFGYFPDWPILPPAGIPGDATKFADDIRAVAEGSDAFAGWAAAGLGAGLTVLAVVNLSHAGEASARAIANISDGTSNNRLRLFVDVDGKPAAQVVSGGAAIATATLATAASGGRLAIAVNFDPADGLYLVRKAELENASAALASMPGSLNSMNLGGNQIASANFNDAIEQIQICRPLSPAEANAWVKAA